MRKLYLLTAAVVGLSCFFVAPTFPAAAADAGPLPNVLFLLADDFRPDAMGCAGNPDVQTPNLDRLAGEGCFYRNAYIMGAMQGAVCIPSRAAIMSGRTLFRVPESLKDTTTWPMILRKAGYKTFATGKWHNGATSCAASFPDARSIFLGGMTDQFKVELQDVGPEGKMVNKRTGVGHSSEIFADEAIRFLREQTPGNPFALYVAFTSPHDPRESPPEFRNRYRPERLALPPNFAPVHPFDNGDMALRDEKLAPWPRQPKEIRRQLADYYGIITHLDFQIGRILAALRTQGQHTNTLVVFAGDNGLALGSHGLMGKQNLYEHSMRVPLILRGPGVPRAQPQSAFVYLLDLCPTLIELSGQTIPASIEGQSLVPLWTGRTNSIRGTIFTAYRDCQRALRDDRWKLIRYPLVDRTQLFDLQVDPFETNNLASHPAQAAKLAEMSGMLETAQRHYGDSAPLKVAKPASAEWKPPAPETPRKKSKKEKS